MSLKKYPLILCALCVSAVTIFAQTPKKLKEFSAGKIETVSVDRLGDLFLVFKNGSIKKYDANGKTMASLKKGKIPTLIEPWYHPMIFVYHRDQQQYVFYDHNFENPQAEKIDPSIAVSPYLVCPTNDNKLLVLDNADWSIKKINPANNKVISEFNIDTTGLVSQTNFSYISEYQNLIFLLDKNSGISIFSNMGKKINHIKCSIQHFGFYGEELFYLAKDKVIFYDLYSEATREVKVEAGRFAIVTDERIFVVKENGKVALYEFLAEASEENPQK